MAVLHKYIRCCCKLFPSQTLLLYQKTSCHGHYPTALSRAQKILYPLQWLATLNAVPLGLCSNPGEDTDVCKCKVSSRHGGTLNSRRAASPLVRLVEGERGERPLTPQGFYLKIGIKWFCHLHGAQSYS
ncbi:hypothetical protein TNCV_2358841 [Trichonephila clavipes]|nr:hypothetical protein TNCV_2358841 [Trichonephila clavipes]